MGKTKTSRTSRGFSPHPCGSRKTRTNYYEYSMSDPVNHPPHYNAIPAKCECGKGIECIQITEHMDFLTGNAMKYLYRHEHKGSPIQDLEKAAWYIQRKIEKLKKIRG